MAPVSAHPGTAPCAGDPVQKIGERFAQLYYGLLAVRPSALRQFYHEESQMSRSWCSAGIAEEGALNTHTHKGLVQIMEAIMADVGGQDPVHKEPVVVTNVENVQSSLLPDGSGVMAHITGFITFLHEGKMKRFSQSVFLERCSEGREVLCVRNDIVHYLDPITPMQPGLPVGQQQPLLPAEQLGAQPVPQVPLGQPGTDPGVTEACGASTPSPGGAIAAATAAAAANTTAAASGVGSALPPQAVAGTSGAPSMAAPMVAVMAPSNSVDLAATTAPAVLVEARAPATSMNTVEPMGNALPIVEPTNDQMTTPSAAAPTLVPEEVPYPGTMPASASVPPMPSVPKSTGPMSWAAIAAANAGVKASQGAANVHAAPVRRAPPTTAKVAVNSTSLPPPTVAAPTPLTGGGVVAGSSPPQSGAAMTTDPIGNVATLPAATPSPMSTMPVVPTVAPATQPSPGGVASSAATGPAASVATVASTGSSATAGDKGAPVKLWVSGIPTEDPRRESGRPHPVRGPEVKDALNQCLRQHVPHANGEVTEVDRKDERKPFAFALLSDERTAKELVTLSKQKKVVLRGERLILDLSNYNTAPVDSMYTPSTQTNRSQWHEDRGDRGDRGGRGKGGKGDSGWASRDRGGRGWKGSR